MVPNVDYVLRSLASRCDIRLGLLSTDAMPVTGMKLDIAHINTPIFEGKSFYVDAPVVILEDKKQDINLPSLSN